MGHSMKGYWINHVLEIKDPERFSAYAEASMPMFQGDNKYGARIVLFGPVAATVLGDPVQYAAVAEFDSVQAAIDFWDDPDYAAARALMGSASTASARRRESTTLPNTGRRWPLEAWKGARPTSSTAPSAPSRSQNNNCASLFRATGTALGRSRIQTLREVLVVVQDGISKCQRALSIRKGKRRAELMLENCPLEEANANSPCAKKRPYRIYS